MIVENRDSKQYKEHLDSFGVDYTVESHIRVDGNDMINNLTFVLESGEKIPFRRTLGNFHLMDKTFVKQWKQEAFSYDN